MQLRLLPFFPLLRVLDALRCTWYFRFLIPFVFVACATSFLARKCATTNYTHNGPWPGAAFNHGLGNSRYRQLTAVSSTQAQPISRQLKAYTRRLICRRSICSLIDDRELSAAYCAQKKTRPTNYETNWFMTKITEVIMKPDKFSSHVNIRWDFFNVWVCQIY